MLVYQRNVTVDIIAKAEIISGSVFSDVYLFASDMTSILKREMTTNFLAIYG